MRMRFLTSGFWRCPAGATSIEYAMIAAGLSVLIVAGAQAIGLNLVNLFLNKVLAGFA